MFTRSAFVAGLAGLWLVTPGLASAGAMSQATLTIQNRFDGEAEVWVDGRFHGLAAGNGSTTFVVGPGSKDIVVCRPATDFILVKTRLNLWHGSSVILPVDAPDGQLRVTNSGEVSLKLVVDDASVWISPNSSATVPVETGNVSLAAMLRDPRGEWKAIERTVWVEPGQLGVETLRPDPTVLLITNQERFAVRALVDGADAGWVSPGETERVWVRPGSTQVVLLDAQGRVRETSSVFLTRGKEVRVVLAGPPPVYRPVVVRPPVVVVNDRPGGPIRPQEGPGCPYPR